MGSHITALLGPTNTGKTHRCVGRMLEYDTGMLGLPLRLLAREVYDRVRGQVGHEHVALVTGEERSVPKTARYWICTTEAMPTALDVDFVGVDEVQLAAHPQRGHIFTDRLLHARGRYETWFLGASTVAGVLRDLVPTAQLRSAERLSRLSFVGDIALGQLPSRSAAVAFSMPAVYALAERLRARHGGVAVVLGALSPRTRNAQVAMYQAGEVDHLVATDAIGMGLNMDIGHVALSALHKFDGQRRRVLASAELAQIAGRAGRSIHDGSFSTLSPVRLAPETAQSIVQHRFPALRHAVWRNTDLVFDSLQELQASLLAAPPHPRLRLVHQAPDSMALTLLSHFEPARKRVRSPEQVELLWEVCQIPDYRKLLPELHAELVFSIYERLEATGCQLDDDWVARQVAPLEHAEGDLDTLLARIAFVRTWTYVCQRPHWVRHAQHWQERMRRLEDQLSDVLHERLVTRFVQRRRTRVRSVRQGMPARGASKSSGPVADPALLADPHHPFAALARMRPLPASPRPEGASADYDEVPSEPWDFDEDGVVRCGGQGVAKLQPGSSIVLPRVTLLPESRPTGGSQLHERAQSALRQCIEQLLRNASPPPAASGSMRGLCYQLRTGLGSVARASVAELLESLQEEEFAQLKARGVVVGRHSVFIRKLLSPAALGQRYALASVYFGAHRLPPSAPGNGVSLPAPHQDPEPALCLGFMPAGPLWVRCDAVERAVVALREAASSEQVCGILGCKQRHLGRVAGALRLESPRAGARRRKKPQKSAPA